MQTDVSGPAAGPLRTCDQSDLSEVIPVMLRVRFWCVSVLQR